MANNLAINTLRISGIAAVNKANSGHPGIVLGAAPIMHTLFTKHLNYDPKNPKWINRDRFILSAGHGSALLYAQLRLLGHITTDDLKDFRQYGSITPGHPELAMTPGVEATTGPLGQGIAMGVGLAVAEAHLSTKYEEIDHRTYVLCGDGDLQEGVAMEAMSFAGHQKLKNLVVIHDSNDIQLDTPVNLVFTEDLKTKFEAMGWSYILVEENTVDSIDAALAKTKHAINPTFIEVKTIIGEGASAQGTSGVHGAPLGDDIEKVKEYYLWDKDEFFIPEDVTELYEQTIFKRGAEAFAKFEVSEGLKKFISNPEVKIEIDLPKNVATRVSSGEVIAHLNSKVTQWIGGSADLSGSTKAKGGDGEFSPENRLGRNILFGVREFAMAAIANGLALHSNFKPFVSTFYVFADYLKPALRLSAIMKLPVTYIMTHDSVYVGEDGPTHQPVEQNAMIRSIPNVTFFRPADEKEVLGAYHYAINSKENPTVIALTRQNIVSLEETSAELVQRGTYKLVENDSEWTLVASGSELSNAVELAKELKINAASISNSGEHLHWDITKAITIEAATTFGLQKYGSFNIGIDTFGESAPGDTVYKHFKLDAKSLKAKIKEIIK